VTFLNLFLLIEKITKLVSILSGMIIYVPIEKLRTLIQHYTSWCFSRKKKLQMLIIITTSAIIILFVKMLNFSKNIEETSKNSLVDYWVITIVFSMESSKLMNYSTNMCWNWPLIQYHNQKKISPFFFNFLVLKGWRFLPFFFFELTF